MNVVLDNFVQNARSILPQFLGFGGLQFMIARLEIEVAKQTNLVTAGHQSLIPNKKRARRLPPRSLYLFIFIEIQQLRLFNFRH